MPELPEVEVTRRGIAAPLLGAQVLAVRLGKPLRWPLGCAPQALQGRWVGAVQRRGKYLWLPLHVKPQPTADTGAQPDVDTVAADGSRIRPDRALALPRTGGRRGRRAKIVEDQWTRLGVRGHRRQSQASQNPEH